MKTSIVIGLLFLGVSGQALSMGHPHNLFAARKQMRAKSSAYVHKQKTPATSCWQPAVKTSRTELSKRVLMALASFRPVRSY